MRQACGVLVNAFGKSLCNCMSACVSCWACMLRPSLPPCFAMGRTLLLAVAVSGQGASAIFPLFVAASKGFTEVVEALLAAGAKPDMVNVVSAHLSHGMCVCGRRGRTACVSGRMIDDQ